MNITRDLCDYLAGLTADRLDQDLLEDIRYKTLDWLGCVAGAPVSYTHLTLPTT